MTKKVAIHTLGCKLNFAEGDTIIRNFEQAGYTAVEFKDKADVYIINTCSVTHVADKKSRNYIRQAIKHNPDAIVIVTGCYAQTSAEEIARAIPEIDFIVDNFHKKDFFTTENIKSLSKQTNTAIINSDIRKEKSVFFPSYSISFRTRSFLKVQDGCDYYCNYCTIPYTRGHSRNAPVIEVVRMAEEIVSQGVKEIVLTGINIGDFGRSTNETFFDLIKALDKIDGNVRYRISSIEPNLITSEIIDFIAESEKFVPHFHIPLQSGSDKILKLMKRRYDTKLFRNKIEEINKKIVDVGIGIDVITGYPTETDEDFEDTYDFLKSLEFSYLHVFTYSARPLAQSSKIKPVAPNRVISERSRILHELSKQKRETFLKKNIGKTRTVLFESDEINGKIYGLTENYIRVIADYDKNLVNTLKKVKITKVLDPAENTCLCDIL
jgi:threonylcarbamoyladenosine tRNA methylthiotransferase MtaB